MCSISMYGNIFHLSGSSEPWYFQFHVLGLVLGRDFNRVIISMEYQRFTVMNFKADFSISAPLKALYQDYRSIWVFPSYFTSEEETKLNVIIFLNFFPKICSLISFFELSKNILSGLTMAVRKTNVVLKHMEHLACPWTHPNSFV